ncbi:MAG TPA: glycosyl hydrolase 53 family protein [Paludibacteraceae bacterium]|jgi:arabinogalactan endo-1,4-beta-galactosidase|nr:glycosyl hydrolase 53 family protein [Paludibacteraceae bacterium]HPH62559.1 glycosyl hydrolase 53 family protein [Paludibacteraceae bacterium]
MTHISSENQKNILALLLLIGTLFSSSNSIGQIRNGEFNDLDGWEIEGNTPSLNNGQAKLNIGNSSKMKQTIHLSTGEYTLTAKINASSNEGICYLYAKGKGFSESSTLIPLDSKIQVVVRGIKTNDGTMEIGVYNDGKQEVNIDEISITTERITPYYFFQGGDITELNYIIDNGGIFYDEEGNALFDQSMSQEEKGQAVVNFLKEKGFNTVRIRLSNNPGKEHPEASQTYFLPNGYQDKDDCLKLARYAKNAGLKIQFTFNYSDYWSNGERQDIPYDWRDDIAGTNNRDEIVKIITRLLKDYTSDVMKELAANDIYPEFVSLGNEINGGLLFPYGYSYDVNDGTSDMPVGEENWGAIASFLNAGYDAVKSVSPKSKIVIHLADQTYDYIKHGNAVDNYVYSWFFDNLQKNNVRYDVIGASYYPSWSTATVNSLIGYCNHLINRYNKDILIMESGYNWNSTRKDGYEGQLNQNAEEYKSKYPDTPIGQKGYLTELVNGLKNVGLGTNNRCLGLLYWDPIMIHVEDQWGNNLTGWAHWVQWEKADVNIVENTTLFDFNGKALPVFDVFTQNKNAEENKQGTKTVENKTENSFSVEKSENGFIIYSYDDNDIHISSLLGLTKHIYLQKGESYNLNVPQGLYIINNKKYISF